MVRCILKYFSLACILIVLLVACSQTGGPSNAALSVENYLRALVDRDLNRMVTASCAEWESQARVEFNSFSAVKLNLENLECAQVGESAPYLLVTCGGSIIANYGTEQLEIDIAERTFQVLEEGGEWRMCGYSTP